MASVRTSEKQNIVDIAIQLGGSANAAYEIAKANGVSITDVLEPGQTINVSEVNNADIARYYRVAGIKPETNAEQSTDFPRLFDDEFSIEFE